MFEHDADHFKHGNMAKILTFWQRASGSPVLVKYFKYDKYPAISSMVESLPFKTWYGRTYCFGRELAIMEIG